MSTLEELVENLRKFNTFKMYVWDRQGNNLYEKTITCSAHDDDTWDVIIFRTSDTSGGNDYPEGIIHNVSSDDVYDMVADLFYRKRARIMFDDIYLLPGPETKFDMSGRVLHFNVDYREGR